MTTFAAPFAAPVTGRLAPSPTGLLHLGNAWAFLLAWLAARKNGGRVLLRMEDIDPDRSRPHWAAAIVEDLRWLGLDWDAGPPDHTPLRLSRPPLWCAGECFSSAPYVQSQRLPLYEAALDALTAGGHCYPCYCTRKELRTLAGAPHVDDMGAPYPGLCRHLSPEERARREAQGRKPCLRLRCPEGVIAFDDAVCGPQRFTLRDCGGDFALRRSDGVVAYQLAVVVDDAAMGVTQVVRGHDILISTPRQIALCRLLDLPQPDYAHIPLLLDETGERLAKRHQSLSLHALRESGTRPEALVGLLGWLARCLPQPQPVRPQELLAAFSLADLPREPLRVAPSMLAALG